jgi:hypothetical protein
MFRFLHLKYFFGTLVFLCAFSSFAQTVDPTPYANTITGQKLQQHLSILAADDMEGRETGKTGQRKAAAYIESEFKKAGLLAPSALLGYQQHFPYLYDTVLKAELLLKKHKQVFQKDFFIPLQYCHSATTKTDHLVFAGYGIDDPKYSDYDSIDVKGKTVLIMSGEPLERDRSLITGTYEFSEWSRNLNMKKRAAFERGASFVLLCDVNQTLLYSLETGKSTEMYFMTKEMEEGVSICVSFITSGVFKKITGSESHKIISAAKKQKTLNHIRFGIPFPLSFTFHKKSVDVQPSNILAIVEGSDKKEEYVFITAHYDHVGIIDGKIYNGADDDGSGTSAVLTMAEAFAKAKKEGNGPRRTLVFMTVSGEEKGLWGSRYYSDHPVFPLENTSVDLNIDMIGRVDTERKKQDTLNYIHIVGHDKLSTELSPINEAVNKKYTGLVLDYKFDDPKDPQRIFYRSDHYNFARKGVPVLFFFDGMLEGDYHQPTDDIEKINWPLYEKRTRLIFHTAWEIANRETLLKRDLPLPQTGRRF